MRRKSNLQAKINQPIQIIADKLAPNWASCYQQVFKKSLTTPFKSGKIALSLRKTWLLRRDIERYIFLITQNFTLKF